MTTIEARDPGQLDALLETVPNRPAVFLLWPKAGDSPESAARPYLARTALLRRRLLRLLRPREKPSRLLNLRDTVARIDYWLTGSRLESSVRLYEQARVHFPGDWRDIVKLRLPPYLKVVLANAFPRTQITTHLGGKAIFFGPFRARAGAERFESEVLDLFQVRRCQEDLEPSPEHPGCIYGEMGRCLRPCQQVVGPAEYAGEVQRFSAFLETGGRSLTEAVMSGRDRASENLEFEEAARQHKRLERIEQVLQLRDEMAREIDHMDAIAVTASAAADAVELWPVTAGHWQGALRLNVESAGGATLPLDRRLRELLAAQTPRQLRAAEREEHLALLARWYYSSWRDGELLLFDQPGRIPFRRLVNAISRVAARPG